MRPICDHHDETQDPSASSCGNLTQLSLSDEYSIRISIIYCLYFYSCLCFYSLFFVASSLLRSIIKLFSCRQPNQLVEGTMS